MATFVVKLLLFFAAHEPCDICKGRGGYYEYRIGYEPASAEYCDCFRCDGRGWNTRAGK